MYPYEPAFNLPSPRSDASLPVNRLADRVRHYFDRHPEVAPTDFLAEAIHKEIAAREELESRAYRFIRPRPVTEEDVRLHTWLTERVTGLRRPTTGFWSRARHFLFG
jgi:hypothetical protein